MAFHPLPRKSDKEGSVAGSESRNFSPGSPVSPTYDEERNIDLEAQGTLTSLDPASPKPSQSPHARSPSFRSPRKQNTFESTRKITRSRTAKVYQPKFRGRSWKPGQEPGIDPSWAHPARAPAGLKESCEITVVDFSQDNMEVAYLDNGNLKEFLEDTPKPSDATCRWISVNGLSWDVISLLGRTKNFHRLAIEDMLNRRNRTKADWYSDHTYIVLPLQKLVHTQGKGEDDSGSEADLLSPGQDIPLQPLQKMQVPRWRRVFGLGGHKSNESGPAKLPYANGMNGTTRGSKIPADDVSYFPPEIRTLQRYHGSANEERTEYMEENSALQSKQLAVSVEQVSIFLVSDNTVVSFFEQSAEDIETPILSRLSSGETLLRRSSNASMVVQAIIDAMVDLAMPVCAAYRDAIDELELNVLTDPAIKHTRSLYIIASEISAFRDTIYPVTQLLNALRDHKSSDTYAGPHTQGNRAVVISPLSYAYFGDVEDHVVLITDNIDQQRRSVENMIDLIFNTIAAYQNESMKQLTVVTIFFLPLSFLTGYFGMNFAYFAGVQFESDAYFWQIAAPLLFVVSLWLMRDYIFQWYMQKKAKFGIAQKRKRRLQRDGLWKKAR